MLKCNKWQGYSAVLVVGWLMVSAYAFAEQLELVNDVPLVLASQSKDEVSDKDADKANTDNARVAKGGSPDAMPVVSPKFNLPPPPELSAKAYILIDAHTGYVMVAKNADERLFPASLTKVLSLYLVASQLKHGSISLEDMVTISKRAWQTGGSRMFVQVGTQVPLNELVKGVAIVSGNDATVSLAE